MPRSIAQNVKLYEKDVSSSTLTAILDPGSIERFEHSTKLPAGFFEARMTVPATEKEYWDWRENRLLYRIVMEEVSGKVIWEGRIEDVNLADFWKVELSIYGYWANLTDAIHNESYTSSTGKSIITDLLQNHIHADTLQVSTVDDHLETGPTIDQEYQDDWSVWKIMTDTGRGVASFGSGSGVKMDVGVWDDREVHYKERSPSEVTWQSFIRPENGGGVVRLPSNISWRDVANAVIVAYEVSGTVTRTSENTDSASISKYIRRERNISNIGESNSGTADARRDTELELSKNPQQRTDGLVVNRVWDTNGVEWPLCRVRAGDVIRIPDFTPRTGDLSAVNLDAFRTFFIEETRCNHDGGTLNLRPDREGTSLAEILSRNGIK